MKSRISCFVACLLITSCQSTVMTYKQTESFLDQLDREAEMLKNRIIHSTADLQPTGPAYYLSMEGDDSWSGISPETPIKTITKLNSLALEPGDFVLFRRGDCWRGNVIAQKGVTYAAYGEGEKPKIYGSPCDAAKSGRWLKTDAPNVYMYNQELMYDVGTLVFNDGDSCAFKVMKKRDPVTGSTSHIETGEPFNDYHDLKRDLDFYHDYTGAKRIYLCSIKGHPADRFHSIELLVKGHIFSVHAPADSVTIDNLCLKYGGSHAVGCGKRGHITVTNCEIGWIGGSIQYDSPDRSSPVRFGNGVEIWGGSHFTVDHCYIYQIYDAGITHQYVPSGDTDPTLMSHITYTNNLVEKCTYSVESFLAQPVDTTSYQMENIRVTNNLFRLSGFGWGYQRPDKGGAAHIKSWDHYNKAINFVIDGNVFDRSRNHLLSLEAKRKGWLPILGKNKYIQYENGSLGVYGPSKGTYYPYDKQVADKLQGIWGEKGHRVYYVPSPAPDLNPLSDFHIGSRGHEY
ncbi:MAG TPA: hypothetical protein GXZ56_08815 [Bacteroidales bacterium]|jgi:hypothetical protein|nr:hypothetical protein [Bacteroidales bacterium]